MKKLEQAIAYFEDAIKESEEIIVECSEKLQKELTEQKKQFEVALKIMKNMKKWNGEGECKYCKNPSEYLAICQNYETRIFVGIRGEYLQIFDEDYLGFGDNHKINFCPMCGRKLGEEFNHYCPECLEGENCNKVNELRIELNKYQKLLKRIESSPKMPIERWTGDEREIICPACKSYICYPEDIKTIDLKYRQFCGACGQKLNWESEVEEDG